MNGILIFLAMATILPNKAQEIVAKFKDSKYFRESTFWIVDRDEQKVPFIQNAAQNKYYREKTNDDLILKARKLGFSSEIEGDFFHDCLFIPNTNAVTMAHTMDDTIVHMNRVKYYRKTMSLGLLGKQLPVEVTIDTDRVTEMYFPYANSHYWIGTAGATGFGRGRQLTRVHGSEVSHWRDQKVLTAVLNARSRRARTVLETTAKGFEKFAELWSEAEDPKEESPWKQHFFAWWMDPQNVRPIAETGFNLSVLEGKIREMVQSIYKVVLTDEQLNWYRWERNRQADKELMPQEYPSFPREAFISSGRHVFPMAKLEIMEHRAKEPIMTGYLKDDEQVIEPIDHPEGPLTIWIPPRDGHKYFMPADIAEGVKGGAFNVAPVMDRSSWETVAELRLRCDPGDFGRMICVLGEYYNWALSAPEMNNHGHATLEAMKNWRGRGRGYPHILRTTDIWRDSVEKLGFPTDSRTKALIITAYRNAVDQLAYVENSRVAIKEAMAAVYDDKGEMISERAQNAVGKDKHRLYLDCVITRMIGIYCLKFLTLDSTYRSKDDESGRIITSRIARISSENKKSKPWMRRSA